MIKHCILVLGSMASVAEAATAADRPAADSELIPLEALARHSEVGAPALSPDGRRIAWIETVDGRGSIVVRNVDGSGRRLLYRDPARSIENVAWSGDGKWLLFLQDSGGDEGFHLFRLGPDGSQTGPVDLSPFRGVHVELLSLPSRAGAVAVVTLDRRDPQWPDAYRIDIASGRLLEVARNDNGITQFYSDEDGHVLLAAAIKQDGRLDILTRATESAPWHTIYTAGTDERLQVTRLSSDGRAVIFRSNRDSPVERYLRLDIASGSLTPLIPHRCGRFDADEVYFNDMGDLIASSCVTVRQEIIPESSTMRRALAALAPLVNRHVGLSLESRSRDASSFIIYADAGDMPGRHFLVTGGRARLLAVGSPWLLRYRFAKTRAHWVRARDGLELLVYVTRPLQSSRPGPTLFMIHGGPWSRDTGGFETTPQLLANRGYTIIEVNFRGSTGLGRRHLEAGVRQFGRAMSDDILDARDWAIRQGLTDPARTCIIGGSYGGYATLVALTRDPQVFRCGVDYAGISDLTTLIESFPTSWQPFLPRSWYRFVGNPADADERRDMLSRSPLHFIDRITASLVVFQGANDPRVTQVQSDSIVRELRRRHVPVVYLLAANEGHGFANEETSLAVDRAIELFLAQHLGGRAQERVDGSVQRALDALTGAGETAAR